MQSPGRSACAAAEVGSALRSARGCREWRRARFAPAAPCEQLTLPVKTAIWRKLRSSHADVGCPVIGHAPSNLENRPLSRLRRAGIVLVIVLRSRAGLQVARAIQDPTKGPTAALPLETPTHFFGSLPVRRFCRFGRVRTCTSAFEDAGRKGGGGRPSGRFVMRRRAAGAQRDERTQSSCRVQDHWRAA